MRTIIGRTNATNPVSYEVLQRYIPKTVKAANEIYDALKTNKFKSEVNMQIDRTTRKHYKQIEKEYIDKFRTLPKLPITGSPEDYYKMLEEALLRNTPVTEEDYDKYFPTTPGVLY